MSKPIITQQRLKDILSYNPRSGIFTWTAPTSNRAKLGGSAGTIMQTGYMCIGIDGFQYLTHKLAYLYVTGEYPQYIDHIDHNPLNNSFDNLRPASHLENCRNRKLRSTNSSGVNGVSWSKSRSKWEAKIRHNGKTIHLGRHKELEDARIARKQADIKYGYHPNHGI